MHECPHCGSKTITCRHCSWTWNPRDPENLPDTCPRCRNKWDVPFKWTTKSKYGHGTLDPSLKSFKKYGTFCDPSLKPKKHLKEISA